MMPTALTMGIRLLGKVLRTGLLDQCISIYLMYTKKENNTISLGKVNMLHKNNTFSNG